MSGGGMGHNSRPIKADNPLLFASGYSLDLYCDHDAPHHTYQEFPRVFHGEWKTACFKAARSLGWIIRIDGTATCPKCCKALGLGKFKGARP